MLWRGAPEDRPERQSPRCPGRPHRDGRSGATPPPSAPDLRPAGGAVRGAADAHWLEGPEGAVQPRLLCSCAGGPPRSSPTRTSQPWDRGFPSPFYRGGDRGSQGGGGSSHPGPAPGGPVREAQCQIFTSPSQEQEARTEGSTGWKAVPTQACGCPGSVRARLAVRKQ